MKKYIDNISVYNQKINEPVDLSDYNINELDGITMPGIKRFNVIGKNNYGGTKQFEYEVYVNLDKTSIQLKSHPEQFIGSAIEPEFYVKLSGFNIPEKYSNGYIVFTKTYKDNYNAGTATLELSGQHDSCNSINFSISKTKLTDDCIKVTGVESEYEYTGYEIKPVPTVKLTYELNDKEYPEYELTIDDYQTSYQPADLSSKGVKQIIIDGTGNNFTDSKTIEYTIK